MFLRLVEVILVLGGGYLLFKLAVKAWRRADLKNKIENIEEEKELASKVVDIKTKDVQRNRKKLDDFNKL